jgi:Tfp pilus assembly protein PilN
MKTTRLHIDFAPKARQVTWRPIAILGLVVIVLAAGVHELATQLSGNARLLSRLAAAESHRGTSVSDPARSIPITPGDRARTRLVSQVAQALVTPWSDLLESLEATPNNSVALLSVEPSVSKRSIRLTAEARSMPDMLAYLGALQKDTRLSAVILTSHQVQSQSPGSPVRFQIQAGWGGEP